MKALGIFPTVKIGLVWLIVVAFLAASGCASHKSVPSPTQTDIDYTALESYKLGIGDQLQVVVWRNAELSATVPVRPDGKISIPLVGDILAAGKDVPQLALELEQSLGAYVRSPKVTVIVAQANNSNFTNRVRLTGAVAQPLSLPYRKGLTALDLVLEAGGLTEFASGNSAKLYRETKDGVKVYRVYLNDIMKKGDMRSNFKLLPSDVLAVPESMF